VSAARSSEKRRGGFTMIELVVVLVVAGVLTSIAAPLFSPGRWRADSGVQEVMAGLIAAQRLAVMRQHDVVVTFLLTERALQVHRDENNDGAIDAGEDVRLIQLPETVGFGLGSTPSLAGDASTTTATFADAGSGPRIVFRRNGSASEAGRVYLRPLEGSLSQDASGARALTVERSTGEVRCASYRTGSWEAPC
jgi:prepilin-type N-terminal cleavage/methylation domain-containing protein